MPRQDSHPLAFAAGEAIADRPMAAIIIWEKPGGELDFRTFPGPHSVTILRGFYDQLGYLVDATAPGEAGSEPDDDDGD